ncbi:putative uncharacterized protein [Clostridium sp. CAG:43]|nr:putative uncharacterized protein [Clostridium sp. CAG:43]
MTGIYALVAVYTANLENSLKSAYDESLQIQFQGNTELNILIQCIVMGLKWTCSSTAGIGYQGRCLYLHKVSSRKEVTDLFEDQGTFDKCLLNIFVHDQIHISLAITHIRIGNTMIFLRKNLQALRKQGHLLCMDGDLTGLGTECKSFYAVDITNIGFLEVCIGLLADCIFCHIDLDGSL